MRVITQTVEVELTVHKNDLLSGKYVLMRKVSSLLRAMEGQKAGYNDLVVKLHNSEKGGKFNIIERYGLKWLDVKTPLKADRTSIKLNFKVED